MVLPNINEGHSNSSNILRNADLNPPRPRNAPQNQSHRETGLVEVQPPLPAFEWSYIELGALIQPSMSNLVRFKCIYLHMGYRLKWNRLVVSSRLKMRQLYLSRSSIHVISHFAAVLQRSLIQLEAQLIAKIAELEEEDHQPRNLFMLEQCASYPFHLLLYSICSFNKDLPFMMQRRGCHSPPFTDFSRVNSLGLPLQHASC